MTQANRAARLTALGAGGALLCAACCAAPFALSAAALAGFGGVLAWLADGYAWAIVMAVVLVAGAWIWVGVQSMRTRKRPAGATLIVLSLATITLAAALGWPTFEKSIVRLLQP